MFRSANIKITFMTQGSIIRAKKHLNRLRFGDEVLNNSEYNLLMNIITEAEEKLVGVLCSACNKVLTTRKNKIGKPVCIDCSH